MLVSDVALESWELRSGMAALEGEELEAVKTWCSEFLAVTQTIGTDGCIVCSPTRRLAKCWYSPEGRKEYLMSGCCEACFDRLEPYVRAPRLTSIGHFLVYTWVFGLRKAKGQLVLPASDMHRLRECAGATSATATFTVYLDRVQA